MQTNRPNRAPGRVRAAVLAFLVSGVGLVWTVTAEAAPTITFGPDCPIEGPSPTPPPDGCVPVSSSGIRGQQRLPFSVQAGGISRIRRVEVRVLSEDEQITSPGEPNPGDPVWFEEYPFSQAPSSRSYTFAWETSILTPYNGAYTFLVRAFNHNESTSTTAQRTDLRVDNVPQRPKAPKVVSVTHSGVSLSWETAPEPDLVGYALYRAKTDGPDEEPPVNSYKLHLSTTQTQVFDAAEDAGVYWYRLRAVRRSVVTPETGVASAMSARAAEPAVVTKPTPTPPPQPVGPGSGPQAPARPPIQPRPLPRLSAKPPPTVDAPFSTLLDYSGVDGVAYDDDDDVEWVDDDQAAATEQTAEARRRAIPAAIGIFMISAWAVLTRSRLLV